MLKYMIRLLFKIFVFLSCWTVFSANAANIAVIAPRVGHLAKYGNEMIEGAQIAVDVINEKGGILGEKINLVIIDDRCEDSFAVSAAQMITLNSNKNDKMNLVIGPYCNNSFAEISDIYSRGKVMRIVALPLNESESNFQAKGLLKIGGVVSKQAETFFEFYKNNMVGKNVAMVYDKTLPQTVETALKVQQLFRENGLNNLTLFDFVSYEDFETMAKEILLNNSIVYMLGSAKNMAVLAQEIQQQKAETIFFIDEYSANEYFYREMGNFAEGIYVISLKNMNDSPNFAEDLVELRFKQKEPKGLGVYGYAAVKMWAETVKNTKSFEFDKLNSVFEGKTFALPWGNVQIKDGKSPLDDGYIIYQIRNGEYVTVN